MLYGPNMLIQVLNYHNQIIFFHFRKYHPSYLKSCFKIYLVRLGQGGRRTLYFPFHVLSFQWENMRLCKNWWSWLYVTCHIRGRWWTGVSQFSGCCAHKTLCKSSTSGHFTCTLAFWEDSLLPGITITPLFALWTEPSLWKSWSVSEGHVMKWKHVF